MELEKDKKTIPPGYNTVYDAINYYDENRIKYQMAYKKLYNGQIDSKDDKLLIKYKKNGLEHDVQIEIIACFDYYSGIWLWSWADHPYSRYAGFKKPNDYAKKLLQYGLTIPGENLMREHFINSRIYLNTNIQLEVQLALVSYILKKPIVITIDGIVENEKMPLPVKYDYQSSKKYGFIHICVLNEIPTNLIKNRDKDRNSKNRNNMSHDTTDNEHTNSGNSSNSNSDDNN